MLPNLLAATLLEQLYSFNKHLPVAEIEERINKWKQL